MKKLRIENILVFGESSRVAASEDVNLILSNATNEYHLLRHYPTLPEKYSHTLIDKEYEYFDYQKQKYLASRITAEEIEIAYQTKGTKFYPGIDGIENPKRLIGFIRSELTKRIETRTAFWIKKPAHEALMFTAAYTQNIGDQDLIAIDQLSNEQQSEIVSVPRGNHQGEKRIMINTISNVLKRPTNRISVEIDLVPDISYAYITAYPGELAPSFPNPSQYSEEYEYSKQFWNTHVFII